METKKELRYSIGDKVTINEKVWKVKSIRQRFGKFFVYDMDGKGSEDSFTIETDSLETLMGEE